MTDLKIELDALNEAATPGLWGQFSVNHGPFREIAKALWTTDRKTAVNHLDTSHHISAVPTPPKPYRLAEFKHADDAAFAEALVNAYRAGKLEVIG